MAENKYCMYCMSPIEESDTECPFCGKVLNEAVMAHHLIPGTMLNNKYIVGRSIGEGGFGITYIGRDNTLDMKVAIKEYYPNGYVNRSNTISPDVNSITSVAGKEFFAKGRERFLREARTLAKFSSEPGIVEVRDCFEENNTSYIVMEYLDGETLKEYLKEKGTLSPDTTLRLLMPVMLSLKKVHAQKLIHRDISPDNIMLVGDEVKLLDFGAARNVSAAGNKSLSVMLKPGYAPEEQYRSKGEQGPWTDIYALCATMYKCMTGITPDDSTQRVYNDEVKTLSSLGVSINEDFENAIMKGLCVLQKDRYQSIDELLNGIKGLNKKERDDRTITITGAPVSEDDKPTEYRSVEPDSLHSREVTEDNSEKGKNAERKPAVEKEPAKKREEVKESTNKTGSSKLQSDNQKKVNSGIILVLGILLIVLGAPLLLLGTINVAYYAPLLIVGALFVASGIFLLISRKKKYEFTRKKIAVGGLCAILVVVALFAVVTLFKALGSITIAGEKVSKDEEKIQIDDKTITTQDMKALTSLGKLKEVHVRRCTFEEGTFEFWGDFTSYLTTVEISGCKGISDYSALSGLKYTTDLTINNCELTDKQFSNVDLSGMDYLTRVNLNDNAELSDISSLTKVSDTLTELHIDHTAVKNVAPLANCEVLINLYAEGNGITDISGLTNKMITALYLDDNEITDISVVTNYELLRYFHASGNKISDLTPLADRKMLYELKLNNNAISDISPLSSDIQLHWLELNDNRIASLEGLAESKSLDYLCVNSNMLSNLNGLEHSLKLATLEAGGNKLTDISGLSNCTVIERCNLSGNSLTDISVLKKSAAKLIALYFDNNQISDISFLDGAAKLERLSFDNNNVLDLDSLKGSTALLAISADNNKITSIDGLSNCTKLKYIYLPHNSIEGMDAIANLVPRAEDDFAVIDLSSNKIKTVRVTGEKEFTYLALYNNPIDSLDGLSEATGTYLLFSYDERTDWEKLKENYNYFKVVDCPLDKQVEIGEALGSKYSMVKVQFSTLAEADKATADAISTVFPTTENKNYIEN